MPRSGSTLVEQILSAHPMVASFGEIDALDWALDQCGILRNFPDSLAETPEGLWQQVADAYFRDVLPLTGGKPVFTDKMLSNTRLVGVIRLCFPEARIVYTRRDPVDSCLSSYSHMFLGVPYSYDLGELGRFHHTQEQMMERWRAALPAGIMIDVRYEDVVNDLEGQARRLLEHCGLPWDDACLGFHRSGAPVRTASAAQVRKPIYRSSVGRWRPDDDKLAPLLQGLAGQP
jgi:hypothetical protein